jgi:hypothetical protein
MRPLYDLIWTTPVLSADILSQGRYTVPATLSPSATYRPLALFSLHFSTRMQPLYVPNCTALLSPSCRTMLHPATVSPTPLSSTPLSPTCIVFPPFSTRMQPLYVPNCTALLSPSSCRPIYLIPPNKWFPLLYRPLRYRPLRYRPLRYRLFLATPYF